MKVSIHQPNYIPWLGFFDKMNKADTFIFMDNVQYSKQTWINRVKIKTQHSVLWLTVPVKTKNRLQQKIYEAEIVNEKLWAKKHLKTLEQNYCHSPYFYDYYPELHAILTEKWKLIVDVNLRIINYICKILGIETKTIRGSILNVEGKRTELLINMVKAINGSEYIFGGSGENYQEQDKFTKNNIKLTSQSFKHPIYQQQFDGFVQGLSTVDILFNIGIEQIKQILKESKRRQTNV